MDCVIYRTVALRGLTDTQIRRTIETVLRVAGERDTSVTVHMVGERRIRTLNAKYRNKDVATDVLSFPLTTAVAFSPEKELGDIFLCPEYLRRQARRFHVSHLEECTRMLIHGTLHLLGYDHIQKKDAKVMLPLQERLVQKML